MDVAPDGITKLELGSSVIVKIENNVDISTNIETETDEYNIPSKRIKQELESPGNVNTENESDENISTRNIKIERDQAIENQINKILGTIIKEEPDLNEELTTDYMVNLECLPKIKTEELMLKSESGDSGGGFIASGPSFSGAHSTHAHVKELSTVSNNVGKENKNGKMPGGRPPKRRKFNFNKNEPPMPNFNESQDRLAEQTNHEAAVEITDLDSNDETNLMTFNNTLQTTSIINTANNCQTSSNFLNYDLPSTSGVTFNNVVQTTIFNQESNDTPATARLVRKAKAACIDRLIGVVMDLNDLQSQESAERRIHRERKKKLNETAEERQQRLNDNLLRVTQRISQETCEQRSQRLSKMRERENQRRNEETPEERSQRLSKMRERENQRRNEETPEERSQRLSDMRQRINQQRNNETPEERSQRLENLRIHANEIRAAETNARREQRNKPWINKNNINNKKQQQIDRERYFQRKIKKVQKKVKKIVGERFGSRGGRGAIAGQSGTRNRGGGGVHGDEDLNKKQLECILADSVRLQRQADCILNLIREKNSED